MIRVQAQVENGSMIDAECEVVFLSDEDSEGRELKIELDKYKYKRGEEKSRGFVIRLPCVLQIWDDAGLTRVVKWKPASEDEPSKIRTWLAHEPRGDLL